MPTLYIANTTKQHHQFTYRHREMSNPAIKEIRAGQQIPITDLTMDEVDSIVKQHEKYGLRSAKELSTLRGFVGLSYMVDKPVPIDAMLATFETNDSALEQGAQTRREVQAAATSEAVADSLNKLTGIDKEAVRPKNLQLEVTEDTTGTRSVASGVEVPADAKDVDPKKRSK